MNIVSGSIQLANVRLMIHSHENGRIEYEVIADVMPMWGLEPRIKEWVLQCGIARDSMAELQSRAKQIYGVGSRKQLLVSYRGSQERWPYFPSNFQSKQEATEDS